MNIDFPLILLSALVFTGAVSLVDCIYVWRMKRSTSGQYKREHIPVLIDYCRSLFSVFLIVILLRSFVAQPYRVPTGSLEPTILPGDFLVVTQYNYGLKVPVWQKTLIPVGMPKHGQIALFYYPVTDKYTFVKRVIGVPGDHISYINKVLYINGKEMKQTYLGMADEIEPGSSSIKMKKYQEDLEGVKHDIYVSPQAPASDFKDLVVPKGHYFMMGDNRDRSDDSRYWGFVPGNTFIGRARWLWLSWNSDAKHFWKKIRWQRFGTPL